MKNMFFLADLSARPKRPYQRRPIFRLEGERTHERELERDEKSFNTRRHDTVELSKWEMVEMEKKM